MGLKRFSLRPRKRRVRLYHPVALLLGHRWVFYFRQVMRRTVDGRDPTQVLYLHRHVAVGGGPVTQLTIEVPTPGPHRAVRLEHQGVRFTSGYGLYPAEVLYLHRRVAVGVGTVTQLACPVTTPGAPLSSKDFFNAASRASWDACVGPHRRFRQRTRTAAKASTLQQEAPSATSGAYYERPSHPFRSSISMMPLGESLSYLHVPRRS